jgi:hypothetical protein
MINGSASCQLLDLDEPCPATDKAITAAPLATASRSAVALANIEKSVAAHEAGFGRERLLRLITAVSQEHVVGHVAFYREIVRVGDWPNEEVESTLPKFIDDFENAAAIYVATAFKALAFLENGKPQDLPEMAHLVAASEALRGQYGKRSPTGLDARLDEYEQDLARLLSGLPDPMEALELLCTPADPHLSAESMLLEDLAELQKVFPVPPSENDLICEPSEHTEIAWIFLRRHARWSLAQVRNWYRDLNGETLRTLLQNTREQRQRMTDARAEVVNRISSRLGVKAASRAREAATALTLLNHLNLALEPCFSFKGGVGLAHGLIFRMIGRLSLPALPKGELNERKWNLFNRGDSLPTWSATA